MTTTTQSILVGSQSTLLSTELNSLASGSLALGAAFDNTSGGYPFCDLEFVFSFGTNPTASSGLSFWFLVTQDGTNYEDGGSSLTPARIPDCYCPVEVNTATQRIVIRSALPAGMFQPLLKNDATGQALAASSNTVKLRPFTYQEL